MKALSSVNQIKYYVANIKDSQRSTDKVLKRIQYKATKIHI